MRSCDKCELFSVCKFRIDTQENTKGFVDYDRVGGSEWIAKLWTVLSERCIYFKQKS